MRQVVQLARRTRGAPPAIPPLSSGARPFFAGRAPDAGAHESPPANATRGFGAGVDGAARGTRLPHGLRAEMEARLGHSFADVRVHHDGSPSRFGADAYASGSRLHFARGAYRPHTEEGRRLIRHELAHVVQQRAGKVKATAPGGAPVNADPRLEAEADAAAETGTGAVFQAGLSAVLTRPVAPSPGYGGAGGGAAAAVVQCGRLHPRVTRAEALRRLKQNARGKIDQHNVVTGGRQRKGVARYGVGEGNAYGQGPFAAYEGVATRDVRRAFSKKERSRVNKLGKTYGCHTCGDKAPQKFVPDHQPPLALYRKEYGTLARYRGKLYPHCRRCSSKQGGAVAKKLKQG
jgi:hypothetical protein